MAAPAGVLDSEGMFPATAALPEQVAEAATAARGENMTDVLLQFIQEYVAKNGLAPKKKARR